MNKYILLFGLIVSTSCLTRNSDEPSLEGNNDPGETNNGGGTNNCTPEAEVCDGIDNNCDGNVDEGFEVGVSCTAGEGACAADGLTRCSDDKSETVCDAEATAPGDEICNDVDDNCDGVIDEGCDDDDDGYCDRDIEFDNAAETCPMGSGDCDDTNDAVYPNAPGACDGIDNNCDGTADELAFVSDEMVDLTDVALDTNASNPIFVGWSGDELCVATQSVGRQIRYQYMENVFFDPNQDLSSLASDNDSCYAVSVHRMSGVTNQQRSLVRWTDTRVVNTQLPAAPAYVLQGFSDPILVPRATDIVVAYTSDIPERGDVTVRKISKDFAATTSASPVEFVFNARGGFDLLPATVNSQFITANRDTGYEIGTENGLVSTIPGPTTAPILGEVADSLFVMGVAERQVHVYELNPNLTHKATANVPGDVTFLSQEFVPENVFADSPIEDVGLFLDPYSDVLYRFETTNDSIDFEPVTLPNPDDNLLAVRTTGDTIQVVQLAEVGISGGANAQLRVVNLTCH